MKTRMLERRGGERRDKREKDAAPSSVEMMERAEMDSDREPGRQRICLHWAKFPSVADGVDGTRGPGGSTLQVPTCLPPLPLGPEPAARGPPPSTQRGNPLRSLTGYDWQMALERAHPIKLK